MADSTTVWIVLGGGYLLTWLLIPWVLLKRTVHTSAAVAWILTILFVPYLGAVLCGIFGTTRWERRTNRKRAASSHIDQQVPQQAEMYVASDKELSPWRSLAKLTVELTGTQALSGNRVELLPDTQQSFDVLQGLIEAAQRWIHVEFYIWRHDAAGRRVRDLLIRKSQAGLQVRLLYDGIGSMQLSREFLRPLKRAGVRVAPFTPGLKLWHVLTLNLRNHRKIVLTDQQVAFTGGMNIGSEYVHPTVSYGEWRDTQLVLHGPVTLPFQRVFAQDWYYATGEELTAPEFYAQPQRCGEVPAQVVADGPDNRVETFYMLAVAALGKAQERVTLSTPYFVPPDGLAIALATAALRGVRVRMMVAGRGNFTWTLQAGRSYYEPLLAAGVEIYEYQKGLFHAKTLTVDGQWSLVGTPNWDYRSLFLNFEVAVSLFNPQLAEQLEGHFEQDCRFARRIDLDHWQQRSLLTKLHERSWRLFAPAL